MINNFESTPDNLSPENQESNLVERILTEMQQEARETKEVFGDISHTGLWREACHLAEEGKTLVDLGVERD